MKRVLILHGWGANSKSNWFPWLKAILEKNKIKVYSPDLPNSIWPQAEEWIETICKTAKPFDSTLSIVGHSLGAVAILRLLETFSKKEKIKKAIFVSGFATDIGIPALASFFHSPFDWKKIKNSVEEAIVIHSDDDDVVPFEFGKRLAAKLNAKFIIEHGGGHLNAGTGNLTYPLIARLLGVKNEN